MRKELSADTFSSTLSISEVEIPKNETKIIFLFVL